MAHAPRILQVNVSRGGIPKLPVEQAWVSRLGVQGDAHSEPTVHGGPHRAVCLFGIEAIERLQAEGHPIGPGGAGENLTTLGVEWSALPVGTRARIGDRLLLELASATMPCSTQKPNFLGGRFSRISIDEHPTDSRMYARVIEEGTVWPGAPIELLPPAPASRAAAERLLARLDGAEARSSLVTWRAAEATGHDVRIVADGELKMAASPELPGPEFNQALGLAGVPQLVTRATDFFDRHATIGWITVDPSFADTAPSMTDLRLAVFAGRPADVPDLQPPSGVVIRQMEESDLAAWAHVRADAGPDPDVNERPARWAEIAAREIESPHLVRLLAERGDGVLLGAATLYDHRATGWLRGAYVVPQARGRGIQRALVTARARLAAERACDLLGAWAEPDGISAANLVAAGFSIVGAREQRRHVPASMTIGAR